MKIAIRRFISVCKALEVLSRRSDNIFLPMTQTDFDLLVEAKGIISRIKVLRTDGPIVSLRKGLKKNLFRSSSCEFVFIDSPGGCYLIPSFEINQTTAMTLSTYEKFRING